MVKLNKKNREKYYEALKHTIQTKNETAFRTLFLELHPTDQVDVFVSLSEEERRAVYEYVLAKEFAEIFHRIEIEQQKAFVVELDESYAIDVFNHMYADDVADFFAELPRERTEHFLAKMDDANAQDVINLMTYPEQTAGAIMTTEFIYVSAKDSVAAVMAQLKEEAPDAETIYYLYVVQEQKKLVGVLSLRDLIVSPEDEIIENIMSTQVISVSVHDDQESVARLIKKYDFLAAPAVTPQGRLAGIVTVDDVMDVLEEEVTEDIGEISGARGAVDLNISSYKAAKKRAPWIIILMFLGLITASIIGEFEETLESVVILASFIPLVMDSAGNTGTQSLAVVVRGLALQTIGHRGALHLLRRELFTGLILGTVCAIVISIVIPLLYGNAMLGIVVALSLFVTLSIATVIGAVIPLLIHKLKIDPAVASGPFITTINDILGLLIYFSVATALIHYL